ncbi:hypothetical protein [Gluconobacter sphaericus]|uniref:Uncharacterized protein n=1 Tax=Gluconobacter sphaericus NBRC 12467 TaxID=1307951 RepID=A0AA37SI77_9PROT|nr:hypothetical protein [Gluconobacter sphaericus]MBF0885088.1 hypothetical protein [Gluconobacter sphaericus]GBR51307.1 hypothetical protein AA12467_0557 [Gluconobacter sphaericus NBRC 12467]GEB41894.1 hypothetical protein GSP01_06760 [Gluconobacter sphaericus NBRC 12467]GLQ84149.1 hypothetical protein GCM10007872_10570 [Gluconobacter sphaericus NBRC 12467]
MIEKIKKTIRDYPIWCCLFSVALGFVTYGIDVFLSGCSQDVILKAVPTAILGAITAYIAYQQHIISKSQKEIAEDKHRLELFEKRFETYEVFLNIALWSSERKSYKHKSCGDFELIDQEKWKESEKYEEEFYENRRKLISLGEQSRFLFGDDVCSVLDKTRKIIFNIEKNIKIIRQKRTRLPEVETIFADMARDSSSEFKPFEDLIRKDQLYLTEFYQKKLPEIMGPYLKTTPYISKD